MLAGVLWAGGQRTILGRITRFVQLLKAVPMRALPSIFKRSLIIGGLTLLHLTVCWGIFLVALMNTSSRYQSGKPANWPEILLQNLSSILMFPYLLIAQYGPGWFNVLFGIIPIMLTSLLWGVGIYGAAIGWKQLRPRLFRGPRTMGVG
jgi:hypothetical protein